MRSRSLLKRELFSFCSRSESLSEDGLRDIIERFGLSPNNHHHVGNYEFFGRACLNERVTEGIIQCLLEYFPAAASAHRDGSSPLLLACQNPNMTLNIVQLLIDAAPDSVRSVNNKSRMPLHRLCGKQILDEVATLEILKLLIEKYPGAVRHATTSNGDFLPIHIASGWRASEFCQVLIEEYPGSERMTDEAGMLPIHYACMDNTVATVQYLYKLHPDSINHTDTDGKYPIHLAIMGVYQRDNPRATVDIVKFLLDCDPNVKLQKLYEHSLLEFACRWEYTDSTIAAALEMIKVIYDAYPEAIEDDAIASHIHDFHEHVQTFIASQLVYAHQAKDYRQMTTPDSSGQLPLHRALQNNVTLGSIKLLVKGNPAAVQTPDNSGTFPMHVACQHHESPSVIKYLVGLDATTLDAVDQEGNTALHLACHCARHEIIALLLDEFDAVSVSKRNTQKKLPIDLLWESNAVEVEDKESNEYVESVFRLLKAYPETLINIGIQKPLSAFNAFPGQSGRKRKFGEE